MGLSEVCWGHKISLFFDFSIFLLLTPQISRLTSQSKNLHKGLTRCVCYCDEILYCCLAARHKEVNWTQYHTIISVWPVTLAFKIYTKCLLHTRFFFNHLQLGPVAQQLPETWKNDYIITYLRKTLLLVPINLHMMCYLQVCVSSDATWPCWLLKLINIKP